MPKGINPEFFYKIWMLILPFVNTKHNIYPGLRKILDSPNPQIDVSRLIPVRNKLWENPELIEEFVDLHVNDTPREIISTLLGWRNHFVKNRFVILKHYVDYSMFMGKGKNESDGTFLFKVSGISNPIEESIPFATLPQMAEAVLLPFQGKIIFDSFLIVNSIDFGPNIRKRFREDAKRLRLDNRIKSRLP
ncbi:MAG: hypothetical protein LBP95_08000 [Deltaproteobacteria bacterium]|jgi:hypothetical protein|nr:hypothetical protein [Deltaproteobacteria bacterium]